MICSACGGVFENDDEKCPYCGTINLAGATEAYNEKVEDMTDDLADLADDAAEAYQETLVHHGKRAAKVFVIAGIILALFGGILLLRFYSEAKDDAEIKAQLKWELETYATLNDWYDQGEYDKILAFDASLSEDEENTYSLYSWEHFDFLDAYREYSEYLSVKASMQAGEDIYKYQLVSLLAFSLQQYDPSPMYFNSISDEEIALIEAYRQEVFLFMQATLNVTEAELEAFALKEIEENDWISYMACEEFIEQCS